MQSSFLITDKKDIFYHTQFTGTNGFVIKTKRNKYLFTDPRYKKMAKDLETKSTKVIIINKKQDIERFQKKHPLTSLVFQESISYEKYLHFKRIFKKTQFIRSKGSLAYCRTIKQGWELNLLKEAQRINEKTLNQTIAKIKIGITEIELANEIRLNALKNGCPSLSFDPIVAFGENSANIHHHASHRKLKASDVIMIDMGVEHKHYQSDMSRTYLPKNASKELLQDYQKVLDTHLYGIQNSYAGQSISKLDKESRKLLEPYTMEHSLGHGIGLDVHELPYLGSKSKQKLEENMTITIEPGIYKQNKYGIRIEDVIIVQKNKGLTISKQAKNISEVIWQECQ